MARRSRLKKNFRFSKKTSVKVEPIPLQALSTKKSWSCTEDSDPSCGVNGLENADLNTEISQAIPISVLDFTEDSRNIDVGNPEKVQNQNSTVSSNELLSIDAPSPNVSSNGLNLNEILMAINSTKKLENLARSYLNYKYSTENLVSTPRDNLNSELKISVGDDGEIINSESPLDLEQLLSGFSEGGIKESIENEGEQTRLDLVNAQVQELRAEQRALCRDMESLRGGLRRFDLRMRAHGSCMARLETDVEQMHRDNLRNHLLVFNVPEKRSEPSRRAAETLLGRLGVWIPLAAAFRLGKPRGSPRPLVLVFISPADKANVKRELNIGRLLPAVRASDRLTPNEIADKKRLTETFWAARHNGDKAYFIRGCLFVNDMKVKPSDEKEALEVKS